MANARVARGRRTQIAVATYLARHGWPDAESCPASEVGKDIRRAPNLAPEVKATTGFSPLAFVRQAQRNATPGEIPFVVYRPNGSGEPDVADWPAILPFRDLVRLLQAAGLTADHQPHGDQP